MNEDKVTAGGMAVGWTSWFFSHLAQINELIQFVLLISSATLTILAIVHKARRMKR